MVVEWQKFKAFHGNSISQRGQLRWGSLPSSRVTTVSLTFVWNKFTLSTALVIACPQYPSNGHYCGPTAVGNDIRYVKESPSWGGCLPLLSPSLVHYMLSLPVYRQQHHRQVLTTVRALHSYPIYGKVCESLPRHPLSV